MADMLSQDEINALLGMSSPSQDLTDEEKDAIGEVGNISMGTAATTLFALLNKKVEITTPVVSTTTLQDFVSTFAEPYVLIHITYQVGIEGGNFLVLKEDDVKIITDLMMGGDGTNISSELTELHLSAISEAMNQMIGSSATSMSEMLGKKIDITPPEAYHQKISEFDFERFGVKPDDTVAQIEFRMTVGDLIDSRIMQVLPVQVAKDMVKTLLETPAPKEPEKKMAPPPPQASHERPAENRPRPQAPPEMPKVQPQVNAVPLQFDSLEDSYMGMYYNDIDLIKDVPLEITVELGKTGKKINEILDFGVGTVVELDRLVGESLDVLANGRRIAKGEVVVVDENYGIRITEIIIPKG